MTIIQILINSNGEWKNDEQGTYTWLSESKEWTAIFIDGSNLTIECVMNEIYETLGLAKSDVELTLSSLPEVDSCKPCPIYIRNSRSLGTYLSFGNSCTRPVLHVEVIEICDIGVDREKVNDSDVYFGDVEGSAVNYNINVEDRKRKCDFDVNVECGRKEIDLDMDAFNQGLHDKYFGCTLIQDGFELTAATKEVVVEEDNANKNLNQNDVFDLPKTQSPHVDFYHSDLAEENTQNLLAINDGDGAFSFTDGSNLSVGQKFNSKNELKKELTKISLNASFEMNVERSTKRLYVVGCITEKCSWRVRATRKANSTQFEIRIYCNIHTCDLSDRRRRHRQASSIVVADVLLKNFRGQQITPAPKTIITMMQNKGLGVSYYKAWKGKQIALNHLRGDPEESYRALPAYLFVVKQVNKDTIAHLETDSSGRFKYMFLAYGVCISGFHRMRKVIAIDGTFLKGKYRGVLLLATTQDEDLHQYPIAWVVVDSENEMSWTWFLQKLHELIPDDSDLVIISDRHAAIISSVAIVYKHSHHLHCTWHLSQNIGTHCGKKGGGVELFMQTAYACKMSDFNMLYERLKNQYPSVASYLEKTSSPNKWSRAFCRGNRYDIMTTNGAESINSRLSEERELPIIALLNAIQNMVSVWFNKHRTTAELASCRTKLTPSIELILRTRFTQSQCLKVTQLNDSEYHVVGDDTDEIVDFSTYSYSCCVFQCDKIPCKHALAACHLADFGICELCSPFYLVHMWRQAYSGTIYPVPHSRDWKIPDYISNLEMLPSNFKRKRGQPNKRRRPSIGEFGQQ